MNSGTLAVAAEHYESVMHHWERIDQGPVAEGRVRSCSDQGSWNRLLIETNLSKRKFDRGEVQFPMYLEPKFDSYKTAALVHNLGGDIVDNTAGLSASLTNQGR